MQNMKRPAAHQPTLSSQPGFSAKRASPQSARGMGLALKLHLRPQRLTDVTGDVSNNGVREMILKPLGFYFERPLGCWRHDGSKRPEVWPPAGCAAAAPAAWPADPVAEILERGGRDGVTVQVVDCGRGVDKRAEGLPKASARMLSIRNSSDKSRRLQMKSAPLHGHYIITSHVIRMSVSQHLM